MCIFLETVGSIEAGTGSVLSSVDVIMNWFSYAEIVKSFTINIADCLHE